MEERTVYDTVPALAGFDPFDGGEIDYLDLAARLDLPMPDTSRAAARESATLSYRFDGMVETDAGPKQRLVMERSGKTGGESGWFDAYATVVDAARSALGGGIVIRNPIGGGSVREVSVGPLLLSRETPFEGRADWIGYYPHPDWGGTDPLFTVVQAPLRPGASFRLMIGGTHSADLREDGWVVGKRNVVSPAGRFETVRIVYFLDLGESDIISEDGEWLGTFHAYSIASLDLAPDVGPVFQRDYITIPGIAELGIPGSTVCRETTLLDYDLR